jgi:hypothetical protein
VQEVDALAVDLGAELRELVQLGLVPPPVVTMAPALGEFAYAGQRDAVVPAGTRQFVGPAGAVEAIGQVVEVGLLPSWLLTQTAAHAGRLVTERFAEVGARAYHYRLLETLLDGPASQAELGRRTGIHLSDMVAVLNELTAGGYVERSPDRPTSAAPS